MARGGDSRPSSLRLRCRAHNQLEAERVFGKPFMQNKRVKANAAAAERKANAVAYIHATPEEDQENIRSFGMLGFAPEEVRAAVSAIGPRRGIYPHSRRLECHLKLQELANARPPAVR